MNKIHVIKKSEKCILCGGEEFLYNPSGNRQNLDFLEACRCVEEKCLCDRKSPYFYIDDDSGIPKPCPCRSARIKIDKIRRAALQSNIPQKYRLRRLSEFKLDLPDSLTSTHMAIAVDEARHFIEKYNPDSPGDEKGIYFFGPPGTGKTMLACLTVNELILKYRLEVAYIKITRDFFNRIRASFNAESNFYGKGDDIFNALTRKDILIIDDFGVQADSEWEKRTLYDLIDSRYESQKPVIITSNVPPAEWKTLFQGRIYSRLMEMTHFIDMIGDDFRSSFVREESNELL